MGVHILLRLDPLLRGALASAAGALAPTPHLPAGAQGRAYPRLQLPEGRFFCTGRCRLPGPGLQALLPGSLPLQAGSVPGFLLPFFPGPACSRSRPDPFRCRLGPVPGVPAVLVQLPADVQMQSRRTVQLRALQFPGHSCSRDGCRTGDFSRAADPWWFFAAAGAVAVFQQQPVSCCLSASGSCQPGRLLPANVKYLLFFVNCLVPGRTGI